MNNENNGLNQTPQVPGATINQGVNNSNPQVNPGPMYGQPMNQAQVQEPEERKCPKCGFKLSPSSSICMHCGMSVTGGTDHNEMLLKAMDDKYDKVSDYLPGERYLENKSKYIIPMLIVNLIIAALTIIGEMQVIKAENTILTVNFASELTGIVVATTLVSTFYIICYQILLAKADLPWWGMYIPVYNTFLSSKLMTNNYFYVFLKLNIPLVIAGVIINFLPQMIAGILAVAALIYTLVLAIKINAEFAHRFKVNSALLFFFPAIVIPIMAFSDRHMCD